MVSARSITAGEGGLTVTKHADVHYRMLTSAYYNKRCKFEIPAGLHLHQSSVTGADLKNRAHPLAIAVALNQLQKHRDIPFCKSIYARQLASKLAYIPFLEMPLIQPARAQSPLGTQFVAAKAPTGLTREVLGETLHSRVLKRCRGHGPPA